MGDLSYLLWKQEPVPFFSWFSFLHWNTRHEPDGPHVPSSLQDLEIEDTPTPTITTTRQCWLLKKKHWLCQGVAMLPLQQGPF